MDNDNVNSGQLTNVDIYKARRDLFAAAALQALIGQNADSESWATITKGARECADAMLKELHENP